MGGYGVMCGDMWLSMVEWGVMVQCVVTRGMVR